jgi:hypothetical protein
VATWSANWPEPFQDVGTDRRVVGQFHLIDGHAVRIQFQRALDVEPPVGVGFPQHARNQVDVDLRKANRAGVGIGAGDFRRPMRAAVDIKDPIVEVFDAQAQARHAKLADDVQLGFGQRPRLALERDFAGRLPGRLRREPRHQ